MSVRIHWRPSSDAYQAFTVGTSSDLATLKSIFGSMIGPDDLRVLHAMFVASHNMFYKEVHDTVARIGAISFWGEY